VRERAVVEGTAPASVPRTATRSSSGRSRSVIATSPSYLSADADCIVTDSAGLGCPPTSGSGTNRSRMCSSRIMASAAFGRFRSGIASASMTAGCTVRRCRRARRGPRGRTTRAATTSDRSTPDPRRTRRPRRRLQGTAPGTVAASSGAARPLAAPRRAALGGPSRP